jgi:ADP-ribose pyrophosphatase YjhB (NUDIX family)
MRRRIAVRAIVVHEGKLLCVKHKGYGGFAKRSVNYWCTPGGGVDAGESLTAALEREMIEETGVNAAVGNLLYIQQFITEDKAYPGTDMEHLDFFFHVTNSADFLNIDLSKTSHGVLEIAEIGFIDPAEPSLLPKFLHDQSYNPLVTDAAPKVFSFMQR